MSLLDDVSIVVTPNGYKAGELYAVIPSNGDADMDVTRATAGTRVDEDGLVNYAQVISDTELITNGDFEDGGTDWSLYGTQDTNNYVTFSNNQVILRNDGTGSGIRQVSLTSGKLYTITIDVADIIGNGFKVDIGGIKIITTTGVQTFYLTSSSNALILYRNSVSPEAVNGGTINSISVKEVTRDNVPRIDYTGGGCPHILSEPERTNLVTESEDFSAWNSSNSTLANSTTVVNPSGESSSGLFSVTSGTTTKFSYISVTTTSNLHSYSIFVKYSDVQFIQLAGGGNTSYANFDVQNGVLGSTNANSSIESFGNGWYKCIMISTSSETFSNTAVVIIDALTSARLSSTSEVGSVYIWGGQLEAGSYATSYIPTSGSTVTRNQDIFTRDGIGSMINSTEGVLFLEMAALSDDLTFRSISLNDGTNTNSVGIRYRTNSNRINAIIKDDNGVTFQMNFDVSDITQFNKIALKYKSGDNSLYINGTEVLTNSSTFSFTSALNDVSFNRGDGNDDFYGKVKQLQVYNTALTDEQLLQLTGTSGTDFYESYAEMASALTYTIQ